MPILSEGLGGSSGQNTGVLLTIHDIRPISNLLRSSSHVLLVLMEFLAISHNWRVAGKLLLGALYHVCKGFVPILAWRGVAVWYL